MSRTDTNVIVTQYRAEFRAEPFDSPRWRISSGWQIRETLPHRRRWTVEREFPKLGEHAALSEDKTMGHIHPSMLLDPNAVVVFMPDSPGSRYGTAVLLEEVKR